jgi:hypothetical protein
MRYRTSNILEQNVKASVSETHISTHIAIEGQSHVDCFPDIKGNIHYAFVPLNSQPNFPTFKVLKISAATYTGCPRRNVPNFGRVFLMLRYTDITQNTYIRS